MTAPSARVTCPSAGGTGRRSALRKSAQMTVSAFLGCLRQTLRIGDTRDVSSVRKSQLPLTLNAVDY